MIFYQELKELRNFLIRLFRGSHDFSIRNHEVLTTEREPEGPAQ